MKIKNTNKIISIILIFILVLAICGEFPSIVDAQDSSIVIMPSETVAQIQTNINSKMASSSSGDIVTVTGSKTDANQRLTLNLPSGVTVKWQATYSGDTTNTIVNCSGFGIFDIATGGSISQKGTGNAINGRNIKVSGGSVNAVSGHAIFYYSDNGTVNISNGKVSTISGNAIYHPSYDGTITINGGIVDATNGVAICASTSSNLGRSSKIIVNGGTVKSSFGNAIFALNRGTIDLTGGNMNEVVINGGTVEAGGDGTAITSAGIVALNKGIVRAKEGIAIDSANVFAIDCSKTIVSNNKSSVNPAIRLKEDVYLGVSGMNSALDVVGNIELSGSGIIFVYYGGKFTMTGNVIGKNNKNWCLVQSQTPGSNIVINGNVISEGISSPVAGVTAVDGGEVTINGNVVIRGSGNCVGAFANGSWDGRDPSIIMIDGNVTVIKSNQSEGFHNGVRADGGGKLYVKGTVSTSNDKILVENKPMMVPKNMNKILPAPYHRYYWDEYTNGKSFVYIGKGKIPPKVSTPKFNKKASTYTGSVNVKLSNAMPDVNIYYTLNGKKPKNNSKFVRSGGIVKISKTSTLKAMAFKPGYIKSSVITVKYTIKTSKPTAKNVPNSKKVEKGKKITIKASAGTTLYYTMNGKNPTTKIFTNVIPGKSKKITINKNTTLKVIAVKKGCVKSSVVTRTYKIK